MAPIPASRGEQRHHDRSRAASVEPEDASSNVLEKAQRVPDHVEPGRQETSVNTPSNGSSLDAFGEPRPVTGSQFVAAS